MITSMPMRGMKIAPKLEPAQLDDTRTQQLEFSSMLPMRSQWNCTFTRPYLSVQISSPGGPTTTAVCGPCVRGLGVTRGGRTHGLTWFDGDDVETAVAEQARGDARACADVGREQAAPGVESREDVIDGLDRIGRAAPGVVGGPIIEPSDAVLSHERQCSRFAAHDRPRPVDFSGVPVRVASR